MSWSMKCTLMLLVDHHTVFKYLRTKLYSMYSMGKSQHFCYVGIFSFLIFSPLSRMLDFFFFLKQHKHFVWYHQVSFFSPYLSLNGLSLSLCKLFHWFKCDYLHSKVLLSMRVRMVRIWPGHRMSWDFKRSGDSVLTGTWFSSQSKGILVLAVQIPLDL